MSSPVDHLIVGLGNPGPEYENTRHNVGFRVIDALAERLRVSSFDRAHNALVGYGQYKNRRIGLAKPLTFMNRSGDAVGPLCEATGTSPGDLLVIVDDLNLPVGTVRLRPKGSSGGHNGLEHVARRLGTTRFPRCRVGIGSDFPEGGQVDYVLAPFSSSQEPLVEEAVDDAVAAILTTIRSDLQSAMNEFN